MSKRSERREADRAARKLAYQQSRQQQPPPTSSPAEAESTAAAAPACPGPTSSAGKAISSRNAVKHGCSADDTLILKTERPEDYKALESAWFQAYKPKSEAEKHLVQELVNADWFLQRANRTLAQVEADIMDETPNPLNWTDQQHKTFSRFQRYQTTSSNTVNRCRKALEDFLAKRAAESIKQERHEVFKEKNKPEPSIKDLIGGMLEQKRQRDLVKKQQEEQNSL